MRRDGELERRLESIEELLGKIEAAADPSLRATVQELVELVMHLNSAGIARMLEVVRSAGEPGETLLAKMGRDDLVTSLLVLYGIHPVPLEARVCQALDKAKLQLEADLELAGMEDGALRLRLHPKSRGCGNSPQALQETVEAILYNAAPDLTSLTIEIENEQDFVPLELLKTSLSAAGEGAL